MSALMQEDKWYGNALKLQCNYEVIILAFSISIILDISVILCLNHTTNLLVLFLAV